MDWSKEAELGRKELNEFVESWDPRDEVGYYQGSLIKTDKQTMLEIFQLPIRGGKIRQRGGPEWESENFPPTAESDRKGYSITQCKDEAFRAQLEFVTHALHWK